MFRFPWLLVILSGAAEIGWTAATGPRRDLLFAMACGLAFAGTMLHAVLERSALWALGFATVTFSAWFLAELVNRYTELPFGHLRFTSEYGLTLAGVPLLVPFGQMALTYAVLIAARRVTKAPLLVAVLGALTVAGADLVFESTLQRFGYVHWSDVTTIIPGSPDVPAQNFVGTLLVAVVTLLIVNLLPSNRARDGIPLVVFGWRYLGNIVGAVVILHESSLAITAAVLGGALAIPYAYLIIVDRI